MRVITLKKIWIIATIFWASVQIGCQMSPQPSGPTEVLLTIPDREAFISQAMTILRERDFTPERVDRKAGLVITAPTTSRQWFEFWRCDGTPGYELFESSIHTVRRAVTINVAKQDSNNQCLVSVQVDKERYSAPERQVTTASSALSIYSERLPTTEGLKLARTEGEHWVPLGRDPELEVYLLDKIAGPPGRSVATNKSESAPSDEAADQPS